VDELLNIRRKYGYWGEIHFHELPGSFNGQYATDAKVAREWFELYIGKLCDSLWFDARAVDTHHPKYDASRFGQHFHAYNRFTVIALHGGVKWHFRNTRKFCLKLYSDDKDRRPEGIIGNGMDTDNFEEYVPRQLQCDLLSDNEAPEVVVGKVQPISVPKNRMEDSITPEEEMIQLCDLLLGAVSSAIRMKSGKKTKTWFGKRISSLILDTRKKPWEQLMRLHRRFSVSYFPSSEGSFYSEGELKSAESPNQLRLPLNAPMSSAREHPQARSED